MGMMYICEKCDVAIRDGEQVCSICKSGEHRKVIKILGF
jgi:RNA polymerase subunit RPABC4/transcription elongation factor Spt4